MKFKTGTLALALITAACNQPQPVKEVVIDDEEIALESFKYDLSRAQLNEIKSAYFAMTDKNRRTTKAQLAALECRSLDGQGRIFLSHYGSGDVEIYNRRPFAPLLNATKPEDISDDGARDLFEIYGLNLGLKDEGLKKIADQFPWTTQKFEQNFNSNIDRGFVETRVC